MDSRDISTNTTITMQSILLGEKLSDEAAAVMGGEKSGGEKIEGAKDGGAKDGGAKDGGAKDGGAKIREDLGGEKKEGGPGKTKYR